MDFNFIPFVEAAKKDDMPEVTRLFAQGHQEDGVPICQNSLDFALYYAAANDKFDLATFLVSKGANPFRTFAERAAEGKVLKPILTWAKSEEMKDAIVKAYVPKLQEEEESSKTRCQNVENSLTAETAARKHAEAKARGAAVRAQKAEASLTAERAARKRGSSIKYLIFGLIISLLLWRSRTILVTETAECKEAETRADQKPQEIQVMKTFLREAEVSLVAEVAARRECESREKAARARAEFAEASLVTEMAARRELDLRVAEHIEKLMTSLLVAEEEAVEMGEIKDAIQTVGIKLDEYTQHAEIRARTGLDAGKVFDVELGRLSKLSSIGGWTDMLVMCIIILNISRWFYKRVYASLTTETEARSETAEVNQNLEQSLGIAEEKAPEAHVRFQNAEALLVTETTARKESEEREIEIKAAFTAEIAARKEAESRAVSAEIAFDDAVVRAQNAEASLAVQTTARKEYAETARAEVEVSLAAATIALTESEARSDQMAKEIQRMKTSLQAAEAKVAKPEEVKDAMVQAVDIKLDEYAMYAELRAKASFEDGKVLEDGLERVSKLSLIGISTNMYIMCILIMNLSCWIFHAYV